MADRLAGSTSPYLLQHRDNPVDWYPWGPEAFAEAARRDVPVFLSIGYSTCHWCHVMAAESFEDEQTAAVLNASFVAVKVDREERPDVDAVYQQAARAMGGGGWPMSIFLTPRQEPFYAGSYWPKEAVAGRPSFRSVLAGVAHAWGRRRGAVRASVQALAAELALADRAQSDGGAADAESGTADAAATILRLWDREHGGFGTAPKFPHPMAIEWLLHRHARTGDPRARDAAVHALTSMARGGIRDLLDGGFARYCTDAAWRTPHFEKMLPDNALLLPAYAAAAALTGRDDLAAVARSTATFLLTGFRTRQGTFRSAFDADSDGIEGGYYRWSRDELVLALDTAGVDAQAWARALGVDGSDADGSDGFALRFVSDAEAAAPAGWDTVRATLARHRSGRRPPSADEAVLTDANALAVRGLVVAGTLLHEPGWIAAARAAAERLQGRVRADGAIGHGAGGGGFLLDHAAMALAELELFRATGEPLWFRRALALATAAHERFRDERGGWYDTAAGDGLYTRPKTRTDDAMPAGGSVMIEVCLLLSGLTGDLAWRQRALDAADGVRVDAEPARHGWLLRQLEWLGAPQREIAIVGRPGPERELLVRIAQGRPRPGTVTVVADGPTASVPLLDGRTEITGMPAAYVCQALACRRPVTTPAELTTLLS